MKAQLLEDAKLGNSNNYYCIHLFIVWYTYIKSLSGHVPHQIMQSSMTIENAPKAHVHFERLAK